MPSFPRPDAILVLSSLFALTLATPSFAAWTVTVTVTGDVDEVFESGGASVPAALQVGSFYTMILEYAPGSTAATSGNGNPDSFFAFMAESGMDARLSAGTENWEIVGGGGAGLYTIRHGLNDGVAPAPDAYDVTAATTVFDPALFPGQLSFDAAMGLEVDAPAAMPASLWVDRVDSGSGHVDSDGDLDFSGAESRAYIRSTGGLDEWRAIDDDPFVQVTVEFDPVRAPLQTWGSLKKRY